MYLVLFAVGLLITAAGSADHRIWHSDQCVQPRQHADHLRHGRRRGRSHHDGARRRDPAAQSDFRRAQQPAAGASRRECNCGSSLRSRLCRTRRRHNGAADRPHSASASAHSAEGARAAAHRARSPSRVSRPPPASRRPGPLDWLRSKSKSAGEAPPVAAEPPVMELPTRRRCRRARRSVPFLAAASGAVARHRPPAEPKAWMPPSRGNGTNRADPQGAEAPRRGRFPPISAPRSEQVAPPMRRSATEICRRDTGKPRQGRRIVRRRLAGRALQGCAARAGAAMSAIRADAAAASARASRRAEKRAESAQPRPSDRPRSSSPA